MLSNPQRRCTLVLALSLLLSAPHSHAEVIQWVRSLFAPVKKTLDVSKVTTLGIADYSGATGESAVKALTEQMRHNKDIKLQPLAQARFHLTGTSSSGRITAILSERGIAKPIFERTYAATGMEENVKALADDIIYAITGRPGLASTRIAFVSDATGTKQIYLCDADGSNTQQVTNNLYGAVSPALAGDDSMLAFTSYATGFPTLVMVDMASGSERQMANTPGVNTGATFSPDGKQLALTMSFVGTPEIFVLSLATSHATCITDSIGTPSSPSWSPDGKRLIFSSNEDTGPQLYTVNATADTPGRLWDTGYSFCTDPEWSPDGSQVAFTARIAGSLAIVVKPYPTGRASLIQGSGAQHPTWSPDGRLLAYAHKGELWVQDLEAGTRRCLVRGLGHISEPRWMR
jgi:TolB protein